MTGNGWPWAWWTDELTEHLVYVCQDDGMTLSADEIAAAARSHMAGNAAADEGGADGVKIATILDKVAQRSGNA